MRLTDAMTLLRPRQWTKNLAVFAALVFSGQLTDAGLVLTVVLAFVALAFITGGLYAVNDAIDAKRDRQHPVKRERPVASGRISRGCRRQVKVSPLLPSRNVTPPA